MQFRWQWRRAIFRPSIFWSLVAIELLFFATTVHSVAARFYRPARGISIAAVADPADEPATAEIATDPVRLTTDAPPPADRPDPPQVAGRARREFNRGYFLAF